MSYSNIFCTLSLLFLCHAIAIAQDTTITVNNKMVTLKEVVVHSNLNIPSFINRIENDTSFYKAFRNLRVLGFTSLNNVTMLNKAGNIEAALQSRTKQLVSNGCRYTQTIDQNITGDLTNEDGEWNYYTLEMYAGLMFAKDTVCGESNIVKGIDLSIANKTGIQKNKEQLKMLFFNPGKKIAGIPLMGNKIAVFDEDVARLYDFTIDIESYHGQSAYTFMVKARIDLSNGERNDIVINNMKTWFDANTMAIIARTYDLSYDAGVYDFDVKMEVELSTYQDYLVPTLIKYNGNWHTLFKKREHGVFTATLFDFNE